MLSALQRLLPMAQMVVDRRSALPILKEICISGGLARVTDLETMLVMPVPDPGSYTIPVAILKKILSTKPQSLEVEPDKDHKVTVRYGDLSITYPGKNPQDFPAIPREKFKPLGEWSREVFQCLAVQTGYCSKDELKGSLLGVHVSQTKGQLSSAATDGHVLRLQNGLQGGKETYEGILPVRPLSLLSKLSRGYSKLGRSDTHMSFALPGDVTLFVRLIDEKYPDVAAVLPKEFTGEALLDRDKTLAIIKAAKFFVNRDTHLAVVDPANGQTRLVVEDLEAQTCWQAPLPIANHTGVQFGIGFDLLLLEKVLAGQQSPTVRWQYTSPDTASIFTEVGKQWQSGAKTLLMPIRIKEAESHAPERSDRPAAEA